MFPLIINGMGAMPMRSEPIALLMLLAFIGILLVVSVTVSSSGSGATCTDYDSDNYNNSVSVTADIEGNTPLTTTGLAEAIGKAGIGCLGPYTLDFCWYLDSQLSFHESCCTALFFYETYTVRVFYDEGETGTFVAAPGKICGLSASAIAYYTGYCGY